MEKVILMWFRRDLRVEDNAALWHAAKTSAPVLPLFIVDKKLISELPSDGAVFDFQAACLEELSEALRQLGAELCIRYGNPLEIFREFFEKLPIMAIYYNRDYEPYARKRDEAVEGLAKKYGISVYSFKDLVLVEPWEILTLEGNPFRIFTPFLKAWERFPKPEPYGTPERLRGVNGLKSEPIPKSQVLGRPKRITNWAVEPGEKSAKLRWKRFISEDLRGYGTQRDFPAIQNGTSRMSPHLRFGTISIRKIYGDLMSHLNETSFSEYEKSSIRKFMVELVWREFFQHVIWHFPWVEKQSFRKWMDNFPWENREDYFKAWCEGKTGYPIVDAAMRELNERGFIHNRGRMIAASFLVKDLLIDWRWGELYFRSKLLDGEVAANNGNWQWAASSGVDSRPLRIFNPVLQSKRYDPDGEYIKRWIPELRKLPASKIHEPWRLNRQEQIHYGVRMGVDYPPPIVRHEERKRIFEMIFYRLKSEANYGDTGKRNPI